MLTKITIRNFKVFEEATIELGSRVVLIGPNNSGKTSALQALALWELGVRRWAEKHKGVLNGTKERVGATINRNDLIALPVPAANLLWRNRNVRKAKKVGNGHRGTSNVLVEIVAEGVTDGKPWSFGLEFDYANEESFYCRALRQSEDGKERMPLPDAARSIQVAFLPPMSGLAATEDLLNPGSINVRIGEGRTAEVLRNLCYSITSSEKGRETWQEICARMMDLFGVQLDAPQFLPERGQIVMSYHDQHGTQLDLSCAGRGLQQTLLLLAYLHVNRGTVLLLDEPDAHLEVLRQRQVYQILCDTATANGNQIIAASHSEVLLNEAAGRDLVVAFLGKPHRIDNRGSQVLKSLREIGFDHYYQAEQTGWVLYLEGSTDLSILLALARIVDHPSKTLLERLFVQYVGNRPSVARAHFHGLREAKNDLVGFALFDHIDEQLRSESGLVEMMWRRREIENYLCLPGVLERYAEQEGVAEVNGPLFAKAEGERRVKLMREVITSEVPPAALSDKHHNFWIQQKVSEDFLPRVFDAYFKKLGVVNLIHKNDYYLLAKYLRPEEVDPEVMEVLDAIVQTSNRAHPLG